MSKITNVADAKEKIIRLLNVYAESGKSEESKDELIKFLKKCSDKNPNNILKKEYEKFTNNDNSEYRYCGPTRRNALAYCINIEGILQVIKTNKEHKDKNWKNGKTINLCDYIHKKIELKNGYISKDSADYPDFIIDNIIVNLAVEQDVYKFMQKAKWTDEDVSYVLATKLKLEKKDTIGLHHINNNPNDNRAENLIYLPKHIHDYAH